MRHSTKTTHADDRQAEKRKKKQTGSKQSCERAWNEMKAKQLIPNILKWICKSVELDYLK